MTSPVSFRIDGRELSLRALTGAEAYEFAAEKDWSQILPDAVEGEGRAWLRKRYTDARDPLTLRSLWRIAHGLAPHVYGVQWWAAVRLAETLHEGWLSFEVWTIRRGFDPADPSVSPRRMTAALMAWLAESCEKDVEWQRMNVEINAPPPYAVHLMSAQPLQDSQMSMTSFQANTPHWALPPGAAPVPEEDSRDDQGEAEEEREGGDEGQPAQDQIPWAAQPSVGLDEFMSQTRAWAAARPGAGVAAEQHGDNG